MRDGGGAGREGARGLPPRRLGLRDAVQAGKVGFPNDETPPDGGPREGGSCVGKKKNKPEKDKNDQIAVESWPPTGPMLEWAAEAYRSRAVEKIRAAGHGGIRASHLSVLRHLEAGGTRTTQLGRRAGMTKQAMGQLVREMVDMGYLTLTPDDSDRRAKLVVLTEPGVALAADATKAVEDVQGEFKDALGKGGLKELRKLLGRISDAFYGTTVT